MNWMGEHLVNFLLDLCAALAATWLFLKYQPRIVDYKSRRSQVSAKRRLTKLEDQLRIYEHISDDMRLFFGRLLLHVTSIITNCIFMFATAAVGLIDVTFTKDKTTWFYIRQPIIFLFANIFFIFFISRTHLLASEVAPDLYKQRLRQRITRLREPAGDIGTETPAKDETASN